MTSRDYSISSLTTIFTERATGLQRLNMVRIDSHQTVGSFSQVRDHILEGLWYPIEQDHKLETFGFTLSSFRPSDRIIKRKDGTTSTRHGQWRTGAAEEDGLSAFYADVDNANDDQPIVTPQEVEGRLRQLGLPHFIYTSFSHTAEKPKFRVIIDTDRSMTRSELLRLAVYWDWHLFGQQADLSIYDPGDFLFAPPHRCKTFETLDGTPMNVAQALADLDALQKTTPACWSRMIDQRQPTPRRQRNDAGQACSGSQRGDLSVRPEVGLDNPSIFNPAWENLYRDQVSGSYWATMRSLLGMVWTKTAGSLTHGEIRKIMSEIDATADDYFLRQHGEQKAAEIIDFITSCTVEPRVDDRCSLLALDEVDLTILVKEGECGQGKTRDELLRLAREKRRSIYVVDKIENMAKRKEEFFKVAGPEAAIRFVIKEAHSEYALRVPLQLSNIRKDIDKLKRSTSVIVFITQATAAQMDWSGWEDFEAILDEVPDCFHLFSIKAGHHTDMLRRHLKVVGTDGNCYALAITEEGRQLARQTDVDDYDKVHHGLCLLLSRPNNHVWVKQAAWDRGEDGGALDFFALSSPLNLTPFKAVRLLGDEAMKSVTVKAWQEKWGVDFEPIDFARRARAIPTADRVVIKYVSDYRDSSITRFQEGDMPLEKLTEWIKEDAEGEPVLWTANDKLKSKSKLDQRDYIPPKAHGRNDLQHYKRVAWLAAMKASKFEIGTLRAICGMSAQELVDWREFNAMYQFVMRCILRDFESDEPVVIYVFSRQQADYLHRRLGGVIEKVDGVVIDRPARCLDEDGAMTAAERKKVQYWREKMIEANVVDVRDLPRGSKLSEREVRLVNRTHQSFLAAQASSMGRAPSC